MAFQKGQRAKTLENPAAAPWQPLPQAYEYMASPAVLLPISGRDVHEDGHARDPRA